MPGLDDLKNAAEGAFSTAKDAAGSLKDKAEELTGIDIDGDGAIGSSEAPVVETPAEEVSAVEAPAEAAAEEVAEAAGSVEVPVDGFRVAEEKLSADVEEKAGEFFDAAKTAAAGAAGAVSSFAQEHGLDTAASSAVEKIQEVAGAAVDKVEDLTGVDINGDGTIGTSGEALAPSEEVGAPAEEDFAAGDAAE